MRYFLVGTLLVFVAMGCGGENGKTEGMPDVAFSCTSANTPECVAAADGEDLLAAFFSGITCTELMGEDDVETTAVGSSSVSCDANGCTGSVTSGWGTEANPPVSVTELATGQTTVAIIVDADGDKVEGPEPGDILACKDVNLTATTNSVSLGDSDVVDMS